ncbi:uncharacterized protein MEPE_01264 [Melanopsichium pennsylvanicum]|uniref:Uncharacterized protein n=2 Tax=Melanopsichium pennsylvanicum TaxID=63383 RepID=A0AAJ5C3I1_9BASI|nr:conserved hypothetical protein [Melanopsichium pennsylvanicum 4]SNX82558.1 uncharacterized protein MEPE_01264 [Melanopsichium pennsylvanicum]
MEAPYRTGMLLLNGLPSHTQIALDAHSEAYVTNEQFAGVKGLPPGWHCVSWSIASSEASAKEAVKPHLAARIDSAEGSVRNLTLRWFDEGDIVIRELDRIQERLVVPDPSSSSSPVGLSNRRQISRHLDASSAGSDTTIVTLDVLHSVEPRLLPYPTAAEELWLNATRNLSYRNGITGRKLVAKVLGIDPSSGDSTTDSLATGPSRSKDAEESIQRTGNPGRHEGGKVIWGKSRCEQHHDVQALDVQVDDDTHFSSEHAGEYKKRKDFEQIDTASAQDDESLQFTRFDLRRSWPPNSVGQDITRWSEDKSWLLKDVAGRSRFGIADSEEKWYLALLCEFELAFILFITANNHYAWEQWKQLFKLFCRSSSLIGAPSAFELHPSITTTSLSSSNHTSMIMCLDAHTEFLITLQSQLALLEPEFWSMQTSQNEQHAILEQLDALRATIARSFSNNSIQKQIQLENQRESLVIAWRKLSFFTTTKFSWQLDQRLDEEAEIQDDLEAEQGEDAPVIVEM